MPKRIVINVIFLFFVDLEIFSRIRKVSYFLVCVLHIISFSCQYVIICINSTFLKAHVHPSCVARPVLKKKTFRIVENRCLQCVESILVNLPQFTKFGFKKSLNRCFWYFSLHLSGYFGLVSRLFVSVSVCFTAVLSMAAPSKRMVGRPHELGSPRYICLCGSVF